jgi:hypothetical protein
MISFLIPVKTTNPNNGAIGNSRLAGILRAKTRKYQRSMAGVITLAHCYRIVSLPVIVTVTRIAPSTGLDPHDGLGAALKGVIDGIADGLKLTNDRDDRVTWKLAQRRGPAGHYSVSVTVEAVEADSDAKRAPEAS